MRCQKWGLTAALRGLSSKIHPRIRFHKKPAEAGVKVSRATAIRLILTTGYKRLPGLRRTRTWLLLGGPSPSQMKVKFVFNLEIKVPDSGGRAKRNRIRFAWSPEGSFLIHWWSGVPCPPLVLVHWVYWSQASCLIGHFRGLHASFCWHPPWRYLFCFPPGLGTDQLSLYGHQTGLTFNPVENTNKKNSK